MTSRNGLFACEGLVVHSVVSDCLNAPKVTGIAGF